MRSSSSSSSLFTTSSAIVLPFFFQPVQGELTIVCSQQERFPIGERELDSLVRSFGVTNGDRIPRLELNLDTVTVTTKRGLLPHASSCGVGYEIGSTGRNTSRSMQPCRSSVERVGNEPTVSCSRCTVAAVHHAPLEGTHRTPLSRMA